MLCNNNCRAGAWGAIFRLSVRLFFGLLILVHAAAAAAGRSGGVVYTTRPSQQQHIKR